MGKPSRYSPEVRERSADSPAARGGARLAVRGNPFDRGEDRLHFGDVGEMGAAVRRHVEAAEALANLPHRGVHALRHTFGAHLVRGASPKAIQELMRHADLSMTQRYTHLSPAARESAVRLLDDRPIALNAS